MRFIKNIFLSALTSFFSLGFGFAHAISDSTSTQPFQTIPASVTVLSHGVRYFTAGLKGYGDDSFTLPPLQRCPSPNTHPELTWAVRSTNGCGPSGSTFTDLQLQCTFDQNAYILTCTKAYVSCNDGAGGGMGALLVSWTLYCMPGP